MRLRRSASRSSRRAERGAEQGSTVSAWQCMPVHQVKTSDSTTGENMKKRTMLSALALAAATLATGGALTQPAQAADVPGVAFVYLGNPGDAGWTYAHDQGSKEAEAKFGNKIKITRVENVPESADSERVFRDLANKGNKIIFGSSFGFQDFELKVAKDFPDTVFLHATGYKKAANFGTYDVRMYQGAYLAGVAAGYVTKTNTLGVVASVPI